MPIYEYVCRACGAQLERLQRIADDPLSDCPECGEAALKRKISAAGFRLAGQGWYETDFKKDGRRNLAGEGGDDKSKSKSESKSEGNKADKPKSEGGASAGKEKKASAEKGKGPGARE